MDQELISLRAQVEEQQESLRSLTANISRLNDAAFRTAMTPSTTEGQSFQSEDAVKRRFKGLEFEASESSLSIEAINEEKSWAPPRKMLPMTIHRNTGIHPKATANIGPIMGAAPAIEAK